MRTQYQRRVKTRLPYQSEVATATKLNPQREASIFYLIILVMAILWLRFFYLQIIKSESYNLVARHQLVSDTGKRGRIFSADNYLLVGNHYHYKIYLNVSKLDDFAHTYDQLAEIIKQDPQASASLKTATALESNITAVREKLGGRGNLIVASNASQETVKKIANTKLKAVEFEKILVRFYPEKTMASPVLGFLSKDKQEGHYGIEGGRNKELAANAWQTRREVDRLGNPLNLNPETVNIDLNGRDLYLTEVEIGRASCRERV